MHRPKTYNSIETIAAINAMKEIPTNLSVKPSKIIPPVVDGTKIEKVSKEVMAVERVVDPEPVKVEQELVSVILLHVEQKVVSVVVDNFVVSVAGEFLVENDVDNDDFEQENTVVIINGVAPDKWNEQTI